MTVHGATTQNQGERIYPSPPSSSIASAEAVIDYRALKRESAMVRLVTTSWVMICPQRDQVQSVVSRTISCATGDRAHHRR
jgi:hypothetical protein